jgi:MIP family channel proteins
MLARLIAEFIGTFALIFIGAGAICADALSGGKLGITGIALAHGLTIMTMVYAFGHISGGHFNPAVTAGMLVTRRISLKDAIGYWFAQLLGAAKAGYLLSWMHSELVKVSPYIGTPTVNPATTTFWGAVLIEAILTFLLVTVIYGIAVDGRSPKAATGLAIGFTITLDIFMGGWLTGAAMNPARAFGPALASGYWNNHLVYWIGPLAGGVSAGWLYETFLLKKS